MKKTDILSVFFISYAAVIYLTRASCGQGVKRLGLRHSDGERCQWQMQQTGAAQAQGAEGSRSCGNAQRPLRN